MSTDLNLEMVTKFVEQKLRNKPVNKIVGEPTTVTYGILEDQVAVATSAVKTSQWGGKHGNLAPIINKAKYRLFTTIATSVVDIQVKTAGTDRKTNGKTSNFEHIKLSWAQDEKSRSSNYRRIRTSSAKKK